jgi:hypothetical protein
MNKPVLSAHFQSRVPSDVRLSQMKYAERKVKPDAVINVAIGNVSLPTNPAMQKDFGAAKQSLNFLVMVGEADQVLYLDKPLFLFL